MSYKKCESCGMPIPRGIYCRHCVDEDGNLQLFDERLNKLMHWMLSHNPELTPNDAKTKAKLYMSSMPAWKDHPNLI